MTRSRKRSKRASDSNSEKENIFHGLINQGSTCYLNSVLQVLFMNEEFRDAVKRSKGEYIDRQLSRLFDDLKKGAAETVGITNRLGVHSVTKQSDAAEYFEKILVLASPDASQIFKGKVVHKTKCLGCETTICDEEDFWHLPLTLPGTNCGRQDYSVSDGIDEFFQKSELSGENQLYCGDCESKSNAVVGCQIKNHPDVLTLLLKRFELDYFSMSYAKNKCAVDVPNTLCIPETGQAYELNAFVEHYGGLKSGHYTATIKFRNGRGAQWYNFNDCTVSRLNNNIFGSERSYLSKSRSAYLLFYKKRENDPKVGEPSTNSSTCKRDNERRDPVEEEGGKNILGEDNSAVAVPINGDEEPQIKQRCLHRSSSITVFSNVSNDDEDKDNRVLAEQSRASHQVNEGRDGRPKETGTRKRTRDEEDEMRKAENVGKHSNKMKHIEVSVEHHETLEGDKSTTEKVSVGEEGNKMKGKPRAENVAPFSDRLSRKPAASKGVSQSKPNPAVKRDECIVESDLGRISTAISSSSTGNDRESQRYDPNIDSKGGKEPLWNRMWIFLRRTDKRQNAEKKEKLEMVKKPHGKNKIKKSKTHCSCFSKSKVQD